MNDKNETKYATDLFKASIEKVIEKHKDDSTARDFLNITPDVVKRVDFEKMECPKCGERFTKSA